MKYIWEETGVLNNHQDSIHLCNMDALDDLKMTVHNKIEKSFPTLEFVSKGNFDLPHFFKYGVLFLVEESLLEVMNKFRGDYQYFPVTLVHNDKNKIYYVIHFTKEYDLIDTDKSNATFDEYGYIDKVEKFIINEEKLENIDIAVPSRSLLEIVVVSKIVKKEIESSSFTGMKFTHPGNYRLW